MYALWMRLICSINSLLSTWFPSFGMHSCHTKQTSLRSLPSTHIHLRMIFTLLRILFLYTIPAGPLITKSAHSHSMSSSLGDRKRTLSEWSHEEVEKLIQCVQDNSSVLVSRSPSGLSSAAQGNNKKGVSISVK